MTAMRIGELAERAGVSAKAIRYYEQIGVLPPPARTPAGYRAYGEDALDRVAFVRAGQAVGLTLGEVREIIGFRDRGETPCEHVHHLILRRADELARRIADLSRIRRELRRLAARAETLDPTDCPPSRVCHLLGPAAGQPRDAHSGRTP